MHISPTMPSMRSFVSRLSGSDGSREPRSLCWSQSAGVAPTSSNALPAECLTLSPQAEQPRPWRQLRLPADASGARTAV